MKQKLSILGLTLFFCMVSSAQTSGVWSLKNCIDYALSNNIQLQKSRISQQESEVDLKQTKAALFPSLSFSTSQGLTNRPYSESDANIVSDGSGNYITTSTTSHTNYNGSYGLNAQWTVWDGNKRLNNIQQQRLTVQQSALAIAESENTLQETITQLYVQILYTIESVEVNRMAVELSEKQCERAKEMLALGVVSRSDLAQLEAQLASDNYQLIAAQATLQDYKLQLLQTLELDGSADLNLAIPMVADEVALLPLPTQNDVYEAALLARPEIQSGKIGIEAAELNLKIARSGYFPTISLSAASGSSNIWGQGEVFGHQLKTNWNNTIGLSIAVPIFDNRQNRSTVEKARLQKQSVALDMADQQKTLYATIQRLWLDANSAQLLLVAAQSKVASAQASYDLVSEQFRLGLKNTIELLTEKNSLMSAEQDRLQSKYTAILNAQLLGFYQGKEIDL